MAAVALLLIAACGSPAGGPAPVPTAASPRRAAARVRAVVSAGPSAGAPRVLASGLDVPWGIAFLPDGNALVTERRLGAAAAGRRRRDRDTVGVVAGVAPAGRAGCSGSPSRPVSPPTGRCSSPTPPPPTTAWCGCVRAPTGRSTGGAPGRRLRHRQGRIHNGGRLAFGPDGSLYAGTGDAGVTSRSGPADLGGKILRVAPDGAPAAGNPTPARRSTASATATCRASPATPTGGCTPPSSGRTGSTRST